MSMNMARSQGNVPQFEPTPEQIREACRYIQQEWTEDTEKKRRGASTEEMTVPNVRLWKEG